MKKNKNSYVWCDKYQGERPANLLLWLGDGHCCPYKARVAADIQVSIGRTNSKRALGFLISKGGELVSDFVLNRDQVAELATFIRFNANRLRKPSHGNDTPLHAFPDAGPCIKGCVNWF
jgi:hypothetical protein